MEFYVGIDVAKYKHTVAIIDDEGVVRKENFNISNTLDGFNSLLNELGLLGQKEQIKIGMEATGHYMTCLAKFLNRNGYKVQIYNPFLIHRFKESETCNGAKTDKLDSLLIARYVSSHTFTSSPQLSYNIEQVRKIERAKYFLFADKVRAYNHLQRYLDEVFPEICKFFDQNEDGSKKNKGRHIFESPTIRWILKTYPSAQKIANLRVETGEKLRRMSKGSISFNRFQQLKMLAKNSIGFASESDELIIISLIEQIEAIDKQIDELSDSLISLMNEINSPIVSIPGIGINLAAMIIGEIGDISRFDSPEKLIKFAGLDISIYQSGTMCSRGKITRRGSPILRYALSLSVQKLRIHSSVFSEYYYSKLAQGKCTNVAIIATIRKLVRVIWKMMKTNQEFSNMNKK